MGRSRPGGRFAAERDVMVERHLRRRGILDERILEAFRSVPRECFVSPSYGHLAYGDHPLPIEAGQTISQPYIVALMIEAAEISDSDTVLEVGSGSGYAAVVMSQLAKKVIGIERQHALVQSARERVALLGYVNVEIIEGDGTTGLPAKAPFDTILAAASGSHVPAGLLDQLAPGGRLVMPIGAPGSVQKLVKVTKGIDGTINRSELCPVRFVALVGAEGWSDDRA